jgi:hypothetical protein
MEPLPAISLLIVRAMLLAFLVCYFSMRAWVLCSGRRIQKVRYTIPYGGLNIAVDVYRGKLRGLATAEVEFPSAAALRRFMPPPWLGREVTGVKAQANAELARHGRQHTWRPGKSSKSRKSRNWLPCCCCRKGNSC